MPAPLSQKTCDRLELLCRVHTYRDAAAIVGVCERAVGSIARNGFRSKSGKPKKPRPADYVIQAGCMNVRQLCEHYHTSTTTIARWNREIGRAPNRSNPKPSIPIPPKAEIEATVAKLGVAKAAEQFGVCRALLHRWRRKLGSPMRGHRHAAKPSMVGWADRYFQDRKSA